MPAPVPEGKTEQSSVAPEKNEALGSAVGSSMSWMLGASLFIKFLSLVTQVVMGWWLSKGDFGVYGVAFAIIGFLSFMREGGTRDYLIQQGPGRFKELIGPLFWLAQTLSVAVSIVLGGLSGLLWWAHTLPMDHEIWQLIPKGYQDDRLPMLLAVGAIIVTTATPSAFLMAKLQADLNFKAISRVQILSGLVRYSLMIAFAVAGFGPLSFMLPWLIITIVELVAFRYISGVKLTQHRALLGTWISYLTVTIWLTLGFAANFLIDWGNYAAVGLGLDGDQVGLYVFAFNLVVQTVMLLAVNAQLVLMPVLSRLNAEPQRQAQAMLRACKALMLVAGGACVGFMVVTDPLVGVLWHGKWDGAIMTCLVLGMFFPMRMTYSLTLAALQARGEFKRWAITSVFDGVGMFIGAAVCAAVYRTPEAAAVGVGVSLTVTRSIITINTLARAGIPLSQRLAALFPAWLLGVLCATAVFAMDYAMMKGSAYQHVEDLLRSFTHSRRWLEAGTDVVRGFVLGGTYAVLYAGAVRVILPEHLADAISLAPARLRPVALKVFRLKTKSDLG